MDRCRHQSVTKLSTRRETKWTARARYLHCNFSSKLPRDVMDNARMNSSNSMHPSCKTHKHDPIKSHVLFTCWLAFNVWVSINSKKSMDRFIQWIKLLFRPLGAPQSAAKQRTLLPAYRSTSANLSFNEVANDVAKVRGNESFLLPAAKDKRTAHSWADKAKVKGCEYFVDAPASKERKTLWIFF